MEEPWNGGKTFGSSGQGAWFGDKYENLEQLETFLWDKRQGFGIPGYCKLFPKFTKPIPNYKKSYLLTLWKEDKWG